VVRVGWLVGTELGMTGLYDGGGVDGDHTVSNHRNNSVGLSKNVAKYRAD